MIPLLVIGGPTASGKTTLAIELAKRGYVTISPDQYGYGTAMKDADFAEKYVNG